VKAGRKIAKRLAARQADFEALKVLCNAAGGKKSQRMDAGGYTKPGSMKK
jgi:hypothetical protein